MSFRWCAVGVGGAKLKCREKRQYSGTIIEVLYIQNTQIRIIEG
ncbi:hypothetical protein T4B_5854 [Trichinella pseudospiralis]|uniref:Uncharacterized protein n=1 Tax=Trichinella pseudospiralis TaxID=6337 RepID=A0A0V1GF31_TRIPS|nr:hypothetical protein T4B_5854 [Trichinella pseudospiralis]